MTGLADYRPTRPVTRGLCRRCHVELNGMRGVVMIRLYRKPDGRDSGQEQLESRAMTMCESCTIEVWDKVDAAVQPMESAA